MDGTDARDFWDAALALYARPGAAALCLELQDRHGANVMLLLYLAWRGARTVAPDGDELRRLAQAAALLERNLAGPLRAARRALGVAVREAGIDRLSPALARLREAELRAERLQAAVLAVPPPCEPADGDPQARIGRAIGIYLASLPGAPDDAGALGRRLARLLGPD